jgi:hypothetical protein
MTELQIQHDIGYINKSKHNAVPWIISYFKYYNGSRTHHDFHEKMVMKTVTTGGNECTATVDQARSFSAFLPHRRVSVDRARIVLHARAGLRAGLTRQCTR